MLTLREWDILRLVMVGRYDKEIASEMCITVRTVKFHLQSIYRKLGVDGRHGLLGVEIELRPRKIPTLPEMASVENSNQATLGQSPVRGLVQ